MGKGLSGKEMFVIVLLVALVGSVIYVLFSQSGQGAIAGGETAQTETGEVTVTGFVSCPSDGTTDGRVRLEDTLASTTTYKNTTCYFLPKSEGQERVTVGALSTSDYSTAVDLKCTESGTKWRTVCLSAQDSVQSVDEGTDFTAEGAYTNRNLFSKSTTSLQFKVEDKYTGGANFFNITNCGSTGSVGSYHTFNGTKCQVVNVATSTGTSLTLGTDGYIDARIYLKTNATKNQYGEDGLRTWMIVDADSSEFDEPIASRDNGATLTNALSSLSDEDRRKYSGYEYAYEIGSIGDRENYVDFYMESADGVNPSTDPTIDFCAEGRYNSQKQTDTIKVGCWTDASTQTQVTHSKRHYFAFDIS